MDGFGVCYNCLVNYYCCDKCRVVLEYSDVAQVNCENFHKGCGGKMYIVGKKIGEDTFECII